MMKISNTTCTGCGACSITCPVRCINMDVNRLGMYEPVVDSKRCVDCGVCRKICPQNNIPQLFAPIKCYAAWSKCGDDYVYSASGGVAAVFARYQLNRNAAIYGCDYDDQGELYHFRINTESDIRRMQSSKYSQSNAYGCFEEIKELLGRQIPVVFVGTPCQVAGLLRFLKKDYATLVTVDLVCHGAPPNTYFKQHLSELGVDKPYQKIRFRGQYDQMLTIWQNDRIVYQKDRTEDAYFAAFYQNMISYDSCYFCQYAQPMRVSDITIGDFWGLGELKEINEMSQRPSLVLVNTEKGQSFFDSLTNELVYEQREIQEGIRGNGRLNNPPGKKRYAMLFQFFYKLHLGGFRNALRLAYHSDRLIEMLRTIKYYVRTFCARIYRKIRSIIK